jgi:hypothetical protein
MNNELDCIREESVLAQFVVLCVCVCVCVRARARAHVQFFCGGGNGVYVCAG